MTKIALPQAARNRGSSGAVIRPYGADTVIKLGDHRTEEQGSWLRNHHDIHALPHVIGAPGAGRYLMERLTEFPRKTADGGKLLWAMYRRLVDHVWCNPGEINFSHEAHVSKMQRLARQFDLEQPFSKAYFGIDMRKQVNCLTHGDPTFDNIMLRPTTGELVFIDPIPPTPAVPSLRCVDLGKMMQSVVGFEAARYGEDNIFDEIDILHFTHFVRDEDEYRATLYWCAVHLLRAMPYVDEGVQVDLRGFITEVLGRL